MAEIRSSSIDEVWVHAVQAACRSIRHEISPLVIVIDVGQNGPCSADTGVRPALDAALVASGCATTETVASTVFPESLWNPSNSRQRLFQRYMTILPTLRRYSQNRRGLYFERLINYPGTKGAVGKNQLDHIIETFTAGNHRRSALQAAVFNPLTDLNDSRQQGFPCLHQVAFAHNHERGALSVTGFYAMQYLFERAYGNYLGLLRLGRFMAQEMGLTLESVACIAAVAKLEAGINEIKPIISNFSSTSASQSVTR